ncbi:hypothetical protein Slin15195_G129680 [Septoria linicola]|uniref:Uncharacterized protein n=1 Tax=Septoria linicola TaxID=215465 RepID=A0A9Q9B280_9PEZI|nr:hypothetical protein Slin15195_G129680 [Septoria linicola]
MSTLRFSKVDDELRQATRPNNPGRKSNGRSSISHRRGYTTRELSDNLHTLLPPRTTEFVKKVRGSRGDQHQAQSVQWKGVRTFTVIALLALALVFLGPETSRRSSICSLQRLFAPTKTFIERSLASSTYFADADVDIPASSELFVPPSRPIQYGVRINTSQIAGPQELLHLAHLVVATVADHCTSTWTTTTFVWVVQAGVLRGLGIVLSNEFQYHVQGPIKSTEHGYLDLADNLQHGDSGGHVWAPAGAFGGEDKILKKTTLPGVSSLQHMMTLLVWELEQVVAHLQVVLNECDEMQEAFREGTRLLGDCREVVKTLSAMD